MARAVLITGARAAAALDLARDFLAAGWEVHLADSVPVRMARWSRVPVTHHRYPPPRQQPQAFRQTILDIVSRHAIALVVPTCEEVFHLAAPDLHERLGPRLFSPDHNRLRNLHDKLAFARACTAWGLAAPDSHDLASVGDVARFRDDSRQWVFKPRFSRFGDRALIAPSASQLERLEPSPKAPWLAQRCVRGEEACFHAVARHGELVAFTAYGSEWRLGGGARYAFEPLEGQRAAILCEVATTLAANAVIDGQFACDVMFDASGAPWLLECNPRATSGVHLLAGEGHLARAIADGDPMSQMAQQPAYLAPAMWLFGLPRALATGTLPHWRRTLVQGRDVISRKGDRAPLAGALADAASFAWKGLRHNISTNAATTHDIEWNGEELD